MITLTGVTKVDLRSTTDVIRQFDDFGGGGVIVREKINFQASSNLHIIQNWTLNGERYIVDAFEDYVVLFAPFICDIGDRGGNTEY